MLHAAVSARAVRFDEKSSLRASVRQLRVDNANLKLALSAAERREAEWRARWAAEVLGNDNCPTLDRVLSAVCAQFEVRKIDVLSDRRLSGIANARHVAMYLCKETTKRSLPVIGKYFRRDHSTVISACQKIAAKMRHDLQFAAMVKALETQIDGK